MAERKIKTQVAVFGTGAMGLWTLDALTQRGIHAVGFETARVLASGSSTRNVRGLRMGDHDLVGRDVSDFAQAEAQRARRSYYAVKAVAPEAISSLIKTNAVFFDHPSLADQKTITDRWDAEKMPYTFVSPQDFKKANEELAIDTRDIVFAAEVKDACIDSRVLYERLRDRIVTNGGTIFTNAHLEEGNQDERVAKVQIGKELVEVEADVYIVAAGYGANDVYREVVDPEGTLPLGLSRAYILGTPRITSNTFLPFGRNLPSISTRPGVSLSLYGMDRGIPVPAHEISGERAHDLYKVPQERERELYAATQALVPGADLKDGNPHACITIDTMPVPGISPDGKTVRYGRWTFGWPGMMTVAPDVANQIIDGLPNLDISSAKRRELYRGPSQRADVADYPTEAALRKRIPANQA